MSRSVLVTGASKGIGRAIACQLAADGFNIGVHYHRDAAGAQETLDTIVAAGGQGRLLSFDVGNREQCIAVLEQDLAEHGAWYGVVSNAGITRDAAFPALSDDDWDAVIHTNLDSFYNVIKPCIMPMIGARQGGRIITLSSVSGMMGNRGQVNYSAAKAGIIGAAKALAVELAKRKITVNCVAPGLIFTKLAERYSKEDVASFSRKIPVGRGGTVEGVRVSSLTMEKVMCPFVFNMYYFCGKDGKLKRVWDKAAYPVDETTPALRNVTIQRVKAENCTACAAFFYGLTERPVEGVTFRDITVTMDENGEAAAPAMMNDCPVMKQGGLFLRSAVGVRFENVKIENVQGAMWDIDESVEVL